MKRNYNNGRISILMTKCITWILPRIIIAKLNPKRSFLRLTEWEDISIYYSKEFIKHKKKVYFESTTVPKSSHITDFVFRPFLDEEFKIDKNCWNPNNGNINRSFEDTKVIETMDNNKFIFTIDHNDKTEIYKIGYNSNQFTFSESISNEETDECSITRYIELLKFAVTICYDNLTNWIYLKRFGIDNLNPQRILLVRERQKYNNEGIKILDSYRMFMAPSGSSKFAKLFIYKIFSKKFFGLYFDQFRVLEKSELNYDISIYSLKYLSNTLFVLSSFNKTTEQIENYYKFFHIGDMLLEKDEKPILFCEGFIKNSYLSKKTTKIVIQVLKREKANKSILLEQSKSEHTSSINLKAKDQIIYLSYSFEIFRKLELVDYNLLSISENEVTNNLFYQEIIGFDVFRMDKLKIFEIIYRNWEKNQYKQYHEKTLDQKNYPKTYQQSIVMHSETYEFTSFARKVSSQIPFYQFSDTSLRFTDLFSYYNVNYNFTGQDSSTNQTTSHICRVIRQRLHEPLIHIKFNLKNSSDIREHNLTLNLRLNSSSKKTSEILRSYDIDFIPANYEKDKKINIWRGSNINQLIFFNIESFDSILKNFVKGSFIHQVMEIDEQNYIGLFENYKSNSVDYIDLFNHNRTNFDFLVGHSFLDHYIIPMKKFNPLKFENIDHLTVFELEQSYRYKSILFVKYPNNHKTSIFRQQGRLQKIDHIFDINLGKIKNVLPYRKGTMFILDLKGNICIFDLQTEKSDEIDYIGERCQNIFYLLMNSAELTIACFTKSLSFNFYYAERLFFNSRSNSEFPSSKLESFDKNDYLGEENPKVLYHSSYRNLIFIVFPKVRFPRKNTFLVEVNVKDKLIFHYKRKIDMRPPNYLKMSYLSTIEDIFMVGEFFVQLLTSDLHTWVCVYIYEENSKLFENKKCFSFPSRFQIVRNETLREIFLTEMGRVHEKNMINAGFLIVILFDSYTSSYNSLIIDPLAPYFETAPFFIYPIGSKVKYRSFELYSFKHKQFTQSVVNMFFFPDVYEMMFYNECNFLDLIYHGEPRIILKQGQFNMLDHTQIKFDVTNLTTTKKFEFVSFLQRESIFQPGDTLKKNQVKTNQILSLGINLIRYLPNTTFELKEGLNFSERKVNSINFSEIFNRNKRRNKDFLNPNSPPIIELISQDLTSMIIGNLVDISLSLEYKIDFHFKNIVFKKGVEIVKQLSLPSIQRKIRFKKICLDYANHKETYRNKKNYEFVLEEISCYHSATIYIDPLRIIILNDKLQDLQVKNLSNISHMQIASRASITCTIADVYLNYLIRACKKEYRVTISATNFESIDEFIYETNLGDHEIQNLNLEIFGKILVITSKIDNFYKRIEFYYLNDIMDDNENNDSQSDLKKRVLIIEKIQGIPIEANDYFINFNQVRLVNGNGTYYVKETFEAGFIKCEMMDYCLYSTEFTWGNVLSKNYSPLTKRLRFNVQLKLEKDSNLNFLQYYKNVKTTTIDDDKFIGSNGQKLKHFVLHFPNADDFLFFGTNFKFDHLTKIKFSNPFKGILTWNSVNPICKDWLCVFASIFEKNTYLRFYCLNWTKFQKINHNSAKMTPILEENLDPEMILNTFSIYNFSGRITHMLWNLDFKDTAPGKKYKDYSIVIKDLKNHATILKISKNFSISLTNSEISSKKFQINFNGLRGKRKHLRFEIVSGTDPLINIHMIHLMLTICIGVLFFIISFFLLIYQEKEMLKNQQDIERQKRKVTLHLLKSERKDNLDIKKRFRFSDGKALFYRENEKEIGDFKIKKTTIDERRTTLYSYFMRTAGDKERNYLSDMIKVKKMEGKELDKYLEDYVSERSKSYISNILVGFGNESDSSSSYNSEDDDLNTIL